MLRIAFATIALTLVMTASPAMAEDCWFPPTDTPVAPDGLNATREQMSDAISHLKDYAERMNAHINCLQVKRETLFYNMNKEQQARWQEDFNELVDGLTDVETAINQQIRVYNNRKS